MLKKQNLHTHTAYCDGKDTPRELLETALRLGFDSVGFSGHSYTYYSTGFPMSIDGTEEYYREINALKREYADRIKVFCGIEFDMYSGVDISMFDYAIGSAHYFRFGDTHVGFDRSADVVKQVIDEWFGGDGLAYAKKYYETLAMLPEYGRFDIIGHFDLITKHAEKVRLFDESAPEYLSAAFEAIDALKGRIPFFEVNTGAIARGYRTTPYPSIPIIKELRRQGFEPVITSDCHDANKLDCAFEEAEEILKSCGFRARFVLTDAGFRTVDI